MRRETSLEKLPRTVFVWASLLLAFMAFGVFLTPVVLLLALLGLDPERRVSARIARAAFRAYIVWGTVIGKARIRGHVPRRGPFVVVSNHESGFDTFLVIALSPPPTRIVSKAANRRVPVVGLAAWASAALFLRDERGLETGGLGPLEEARQLIERGVSVAFFVEGSRSRGRGVRRFRRGAFELAAATGVPVLPIVIAGSGEFMPPGVGPLGPLRVTMEVLPPRRVLGDVDEFRKALRAEIAARHAAILAEPHHAVTRSERSIVPTEEPALES
ncbi:MAG TPA: lysophospholipid acyltransferase family protein [Planctomycetota bacterium]|nr:lysophospholipid acyltransferase family protein [Planctomycetota bacterium]